MPVKEVPADALVKATSAPVDSRTVNTAPELTVSLIAAEMGIVSPTL